MCETAGLCFLRAADLNVQHPPHTAFHSPNSTLYIQERDGMFEQRLLVVVTVVTIVVILTVVVLAAAAATSPPTKYRVGTLHVSPIIVLISSKA